MTSPEDDKDPSYRVGYARPPAEHRFKKGTSGNFKGKSQGRKNLKAEVLEELAVRVSVKKGGPKQQVSTQTVIVKRLVSDAARGNAKARDQLLRLIGEIEKHEPAKAESPFKTPKDAEILARFKADLVKSIKDGNHE